MLLSISKLSLQHLKKTRDQLKVELFPQQGSWGLGSLLPPSYNHHQFFSVNIVFVIINSMIMWFISSLPPPGLLEPHRGNIPTILGRSSVRISFRLPTPRTWSSLCFYFDSSLWTTKAGFSFISIWILFCARWQGTHYSTRRFFWDNKITKELWHVI